MITIPFLVCIIAFILWIVFSAPTPSHWIKPVLAKAAEWLFVLGGLWTLALYAGKAGF